MSGLTLRSVNKSFGETHVIHDVNLDIEPGEFVVFVGPSGCGKSTLLRLIAGLEDITAGNISIGERLVNALDPAERGVAMVFQTYALYPHMTVEENMGFGLRMNRAPKTLIAERVAEAARILRLDELLKRKPKQLSGGQRQRVAIGRAIVRHPEVFLFDEPLSNLDAELRVQMRVEISRLHDELDATMIYVTHDQVEAMTMADKIVVLRDGRVEQVGAPLALYDDPDNLFVAGFIGSPRMNFFEAQVEQASNGGCTVSLAGHDNVHLGVTLRGAPPPRGTPLKLGIRPEHFGTEGAAAIPLLVDVVENLGGASFIYATSPGGEAAVVETHDRHGRSVRPGEKFEARFDPAQALLFDTQERRVR